MAEPRPATLITGASAGLGVEFARQCTARGDEVVLVARRRDRLQALAVELGPNAHVVEADLSQPGSGTRVVAEAAARGLWVRVLINNAGFGVSGAFAELPAERQLETIDLNVRALTELCAAVLPEMRRKRDGAILNVASTAAFQAGPYMAVYYASKAYVLSFTEALHQELKGSGVRVTALCPGPTATEFFEVAGAPDGRLAKMATDPVAVVRAGLDGLAKEKAIVVPGLMNKVGAQSNRLLPRAAMRRIIARLKG
ncbi:MAG TPA: SDR family oxidoreductase [Allosphingosinicella sp.]|nr:SDR family oxidoreductase [Allosphingosinicella sp.]